MEPLGKDFHGGDENHGDTQTHHHPGDKGNFDPRRKPEKNVVFDDSYEVWLDTGTHTDDGQPCFFQFLGNYAGARYDILHLPAVGNSRIGWSSNWETMLSI